MRKERKNIKKVFFYIRCKAVVVSTAGVLLFRLLVGTRVCALTTTHYLVAQLIYRLSDYQFVSL